MNLTSMDYIAQSFSVSFKYRVYFTTDLFSTSNPALRTFLQEKAVPGTHQKILFVADQEVIHAHPHLPAAIEAYFAHYSVVQPIGGLPEPVPVVRPVGELLIVPGGEGAKNDPALFDGLVKAVDQFGIDRHSYVAAIGGGSVLDLVGYAAAVSHRGIRHIRIPTTVLSQNDSGVGVKNGINYAGKKNFLGTFAPPVAVFNDDLFLPTLSPRNRRSGIAEAIKVALIKDAPYFEWIEQNVQALADGDRNAMNYMIRRCAALHLEHIGGGDPFEMGSSRPLDFGHWSAHKLEQLTHFDILHGEAVAMGIALDTVYSALSGLLSVDKEERILQVLSKLGFDITHPLMQMEGKESPVLSGLQEFREHLGGRLTIMLLTDIGTGIEVHTMDTDILIKAGQKLKKEYPCTPMPGI